MLKKELNICYKDYTISCRVCPNIYINFIINLVITGADARFFYKSGKLKSTDKKGVVPGGAQLWDQC